MGSGLQDFHGNFQVNITCFPFFPGLIKLIKLSLTVKTDDVTSSTVDVDLYKRLQVVQGQMD